MSYQSGKMISKGEKRKFLNLYYKDLEGLILKRITELGLAHQQKEQQKCIRNNNSNKRNEHANIMIVRNKES